MTTTTHPHRTKSAARPLAAVLLSRRGAVYLPDTAASGAAPPDSLAGVTLLEADLLERGFLVTAPLRDALSRRSPTALAACGNTLLADIDEALGADRKHTPLFRDFPAGTPQDTLAFFVDRVLTLMLQQPEQPCVLCGTTGAVHAVSPCAHLVCGNCFDGSNLSACPICHRAIDSDDPFLRPAKSRPWAGRHRALPERMRVLAHGGDLAARDQAVSEELRALLGRTAALSPQEADDLVTLLGTRGRTDLTWLPRSLPGRETKALVLAWLLGASPATRDTVTRDSVLPAVTARIDTATDILRLLAVLSGGDPGLVDVPRLAPVPRPLRRALLAALDALDPALAVPDMRRRRRAWIRAAHALHPFEHAARYPRAALSVAALRDIRIPEDRLGTALRTTAGALTDIDATGAKITVDTWAGRVEAALAGHDTRTATTYLAQRPGELLRRLDHLLRLAGTDAGHVVEALVPALPHVSPAVLLSTLGAVRSRRGQQHTRVFFPKGGNARVHLMKDSRLPLPAAPAGAAVHALTTEVLRRAAAGGPVGLAVVDAALDGVIAPFTERTASRALVTVPRGSELTVPAGRTLRLFLHWTESPTSGRTDLDLSLALFDETWTHIGTCDYTSLRHAGSAAVHSGDLTSAPAPAGASEFIDLDLAKLEAAGARYAVAVCFSYNNVPFVELAEAFAGFMARDEPGGHGEVFEPRAVEQRFDLTGTSRACVPLILDIRGRTMRWLDVVEGVSGTDHAVHSHVDQLAALGRRLTELFASGARVGLGELATWQAAARAATVVVRHTDGSAGSYRRRDGEDAAAFAARIATPEGEECEDTDLTRAELAFLLREDIALAEGCEVYALHPGGLDTARVRLLTASDVVNTLAQHGSGSP
jgi:hypothetical protein